MDKFQKEVIQAQLNNEKECLEALEQSYKNALDDINGKIADLKGRDDADLQHVIYQVQYQEALKKQMESSLDILQTQNFESVSQYLTTCYEEGYVGTIYNLQNQGIPLIFPIDQAQVVDAVTHDTKLSTDLYTALGKDIAKLKKDISSEISRGISTGMTYTDIAKNVSRYAGISKSNATRIARTEGHRIASKATMNACEKAKDMGADIVKQWDATLDGRTRPSHRSVDGEIREVDEAFSNGLMYPSDPDGGASESINCRCVLLEMPRWALDGKFTKRDSFSDEILEFDSYKDYDDFKNKYWSKENIQYMNYVDKLETRYNTKNFESILTNMTDREYKHYAKLLESNPMYKSSSVTQVAQKMNERRSINKSVFKTMNNSNADSIRPHNLMKEMNKSEVGKEALQYIEENQVPVYLYYGVDNPMNDRGLYDPVDDVISIYCDVTKTIETTATTVIHEAKHRMLGCQGTLDEEVECFKVEWIHKKGELTESDIDAIITLVQRLYPELS